jgi:hypothetical protein
MTRRKLTAPALAAIAGAAVLCGPAAAHAAPIGPCAEVPYVGVCVPPSGEPTTPPTLLPGPGNGKDTVRHRFTTHSVDQRRSHWERAEPLPSPMSRQLPTPHAVPTPRRAHQSRTPTRGGDAELVRRLPDGPGNAQTVGAHDEGLPSRLHRGGRSADRRPADRHRGNFGQPRVNERRYPGGMLAFIRKKFVGSYLALRAVNRVHCWPVYAWCTRSAASSLVKFT